MDSPSPAQIIRTRRRTISLEVTKEATLIVRAPLRAPERVIDQFIREKQDWIERKLTEARNRPAAPHRTFAVGELFLFLGKTYPLDVLPGSDAGISLGEKFYVGESRLPECRDLLRAWYVQRALEIFPARVAGFAAILDYRPKKIRVTDTRRRWASCSTSGTLSFCWRLVLAPPEVIDYVIVHELVHMRQPDHSPRFWEKVGQAMPRYKEHREWLRTHERMLEL